MNLSLDLMHSLRLSRKNFGFVSLCVLIIGLGMTLTMMLYIFIFSIVYKPLPFPNGDRFVGIRTIDKDTEQPRELSPTVDAYLYQNLLKGVDGFDAIGAYRSLRATFSDGDVANEYLAAHIEPKVLAMSAEQPLLGRSLQESDDIAGAEPVVVISYRVWQNYYAGNADIIGHTSRINGIPRTIVGVMPDNFYYPFIHELWLPLQLPNVVNVEERRSLEVMGILAEGTSYDAVNGELAEKMVEYARAWPEFYGNQSLDTKFYIHTYAPNIVIFHVLGALAFALMLLICLNLANLLVVRNNERLRELAIRNALGASHWRLIKSILLDSLLICVWGSLLGFILSHFAMQALYNSMTGSSPTGNLPFWWSFSWDIYNGMAALLIVICIWLVSAGLAVRKILKQDLNTLLSGNAKGAVGNDNTRGSSFLVGFETVFSFFLLVLSGAFIGVTWDLTNVDYGTATEGYLTGSIRLPDSNYAEQTSRQEFRDNLANTLLNKAGVQEVAFVSALPSESGLLVQYALEDRDSRDASGEYSSIDLITTSDNYFSAIEAELIDGRGFNSSDTTTSTPVAIIDEQFARQMWPDQSAVGKRLQINPDNANAEWLTVVGVSSRILQREAAQDNNNLSVYLPMSQGRGISFSVVVKTEGNPLSYRRLLQEAVASTDRDIPVTYIESMRQVLDKANNFNEFLNRITSFIACFTMVLALTGIYAIVSRSVSQRRHEIGIRRAIGSSNFKVLWIFARQGLIFLSLGFIIGGGGAVVLSTAIETVFAGVVSWLPTVLITVTVSLGLLILLAVYNPARKLITVEPGNALRYD